MDKEKLESMLIDYIDGKLTEADKAIVERELAQSKDANQLYEQLREVMSAMEKSEKLEPGARLRVSFDKLLREEIAKQKSSTTISLFQPTIYRMAAGLVLVMAGIGIGYWVNTNSSRCSSVSSAIERWRIFSLSCCSAPSSESITLSLIFSTSIKSDFRFLWA